MNLQSSQSLIACENDRSNAQIILASQSPQRKTLLEQVGFDIQCCPVDIDESLLADELPADLVVRLALGKALRCFELQKATNKTAKIPARLIIGADTTIDLDNTSLGKPVDEFDALDMLHRLANREHLVHSGICVIDATNGAAETQLVTTIVRFGPISALQAKQYWDSGEPKGKAGAYGIQGLGAQFVAHLSGSYSNVVGLPLYETLQLVEKVT
jgi:septum formation protein